MILNPCPPGVLVQGLGERGDPVEVSWVWVGEAAAHWSGQHSRCDELRLVEVGGVRGHHVGLTVALVITLAFLCCGHSLLPPPLPARLIQESWRDQSGWGKEQL